MEKKIWNSPEVKELNWEETMSGSITEKDGETLGICFGGEEDGYGGEEDGFGGETDDGFRGYPSACLSS